mgnify:CR=1 FL=1
MVGIEQLIVNCTIIYTLVYKMSVDSNEYVINV